MLFSFDGQVQFFKTSILGALEEHGLTLDDIYRSVEALEPYILLFPGLPFYEANDFPQTTARSPYLNLLHDTESGAKTVPCPFEHAALFGTLIDRSYREYMRLTDRPAHPYTVNMWANLWREGESLTWHGHDFDVHGYICIHAQPSTTLFRSPYDGAVHPNENVDGMLYLFSDEDSPERCVWPHQISAWEHEGRRLTLGFDISLNPA